MSMQFYKIRALFLHSLKDLLKNFNVLFLGLLPIGFTALYRYMSFGGESMPAEMVMSFGLVMNASLIPLSVMAMAIAEEKEKNTLRSLMLSNVSAMEFLVSKFLLIFLMAQVVNLSIYAVVGAAQLTPVRFLLVTSLSMAPPILLGALVGILSKNLMSTGTMGAPIGMVLLIPSIFGRLDDGFYQIARFTPTMAMMNLLEKNEEGFSIAVLVVWVVLSAALFMVVYRKKRLD